MKPLDFEGSNITLIAPKGKHEKDIKTIKGYQGIDDMGLDYVVTMWQPSEEEKQAIANGSVICLKVIGQAIPPVALFTLDLAEGEQK